MNRIHLVACMAGLAALLGSTHARADEPGFTAPRTGKIPVAVVVTENANLIDFAGPLEVFGNAKVEDRGEPNDDYAKDDRSSANPPRP
jgi:hypothetical protein